jgi:predicted ferric reductase
MSVWPAPGEDLGDVVCSLVRLAGAERMVTGLMGLALLLVLVWLATQRDKIGMPYELWRLSHGVSALILLLLSAHHAWTNGIFIRTLGSGAVVGAGLLAALASFAVIYLVRGLRARHPDWKVEQVMPLGGGLHELTLSTSKRSCFKFQAGQFAWVTFGGRHPVTDHPFSIASSPTELPRLRFVIKENGDFTGTIGDMPKGTTAYLDGPHGNLVADMNAEAIVLVAGGVGIAPIISIVRSLADQNYLGRVALLIATQTVAEQIFAAEVEGLSSKLNLHAVFVVEEPSASWRGELGRIDEAKLRRLLSGISPARADILLCGPLAMMSVVSTLLLKMGALRECIRYERFDYHEGSDPKSRSMRRSALLLFATAAGLVVMTAAAGTYFS